MIFTTSPEIAADVETVVNILANLPVDGIMDYNQASDAIGRDVTHTARYILDRARKLAEEQTGSLYESVRGTGIKRLTPADASMVGAAAIGKIRRHARRGMKRLALIRGNMTSADQAKVVAYQSQLGAIAVASTPSATKRIEGTINDSAVVPAGRIFDLFK